MQYDVRQLLQKLSGRRPLYSENLAKVSYCRYIPFHVFSEVIGPFDIILTAVSG